MKRLASALVLLLLCLACLTSQAGQVPFEDDYEGINRAAQSVLMLLVYDNEEGDYIATGSGFVAFDSATLITNYHVLEEGDLVMAESDEGRSYFLDQVIVADKRKDLAILRFKGDTKLPPLPLNREGGILRGQPVVAIGSPEGYINTVSKGDISALFTEEGLRYIQFTAPISHGSSGGALFDNQGQVIGVTSSSIMGDSQNLNFAIDIREAIALYESAEAGAAYDLSLLGSQAQRGGLVPQVTTAPDAISQYTGLRAKQLAPDIVLLEWESRDPGETSYIGYEIEGNSYYTHLDADGKSVEIADLLPGYTYHFFIAGSLEGLERPEDSVSLSLEAPQPYQERGAKLLALGAFYLERGGQAAQPLPQPESRLSTRQLHLARQEMELSLIYRLLLEEARGDSRGSVVYALTTPGGFVYTDEYYFQYEAEWNSYLRSVDLKDLLGDVLRFEDGFPEGPWKLAVYSDGALLGETRFEVYQGEDEAAVEKGNFEDSLAIAALENGAALSWDRAEGASEYRIYRATGADGHYFFQETTQDTSYTDINLIKGRTYVFRVDALLGDGRVLTGTPREVKPGQPGTEGETASLALKIGDEAYVGTTLQPYIDPDVLNTTALDNIAGFSLAYYGEDRDYQALTFGESGQLLTYFSFDVRVPPGEIVNPGRVSLKKYGPSLMHVYVAISEIRFDDGSVVKVPAEKLDFESWTLD